MSEVENVKPVVIDENVQRIKELEGALAWLRDNVVHGNVKHVQKINEILGGN